MTLIIFYQTNNLANGGVRSLLKIAGGLDSKDIILFTNKRVNEVSHRCYTSLWPYGNYFYRLIVYPIWFKNIVKLLLSNRVKKVIINDLKSLIIFSPLLLIRRYQVVFNVRDTLLEYNAKWRLLNLVDQVVCMSHEMRDHLVNHLGVNLHDKITVCYSVVDPIKQHSPIGRKIVYYLGSLCEKKNQLALLKALEVARPDFHIRFLGDSDEDYGRLCQRTIDESLYLSTHVEVLGFAENPYANIGYGDILIQPSTREGMARSMLEALSIGIPVVSFDVCSAREILEKGACGIVIKQGCYGELFENVTLLLKDRSLYDEMSRNARIIIQERFRKTEVLERYREIYL